ncbi:glycoside hydrolase family 79 protein, partial [Mycena polygramma]
MEIPLSPPSTHAVSPNFLGISFELSSISNYFGNDTSTIPQPMINYLAGIRARTGDESVRLRIGGNSADISTYVESQASPMTVLNNPDASPDDQSVDYGPVIWSTLAKVGQTVGGVDYLFSVPLLNPNNTIPRLAADAKAALGDSLDALLLGNEPDLYQSHKERPDFANYTVQIYQTVGRNLSILFRRRDTSATPFYQEFSNTVDVLQSIYNNFAGLTICCDTQSWELENLLQAGYLSNFTLKYVTSPQNFCPRIGRVKPAFDISYYMQHSNVVTLAAWSSPAYKTIAQSDSPRLVLSEFNSASCGGIPGLSDTFAVGALWTADYSLQLASVGYTAAYIHTRERGITYNVLTPPGVGDGAPGNWTTNPPYYAILAVAETLQTENGGIVVDLNLKNSTTNAATSQVGYAVYDAKNNSVTRLVLFNYAAESTRFTLPAMLFANSTLKTVLIKFMAAESGAHEMKNISWGGKTYAGVGNGQSAADTTWSTPNQNLECTGGCSFNASGESMAVVFLDNAQFAAVPAPGTVGPQPTQFSSNGALKFCAFFCGLFGAVSVAA